MRGSRRCARSGPLRKSTHARNGHARFRCRNHEQHHQLEVRTQAADSSGLSDRGRLRGRLVLGRRPSQLRAATVDVDTQVCRRRPRHPEDGRPSGAVDDAGLPGRQEQPSPDAPRGGRHRHRSPESGRHRTGGGHAASAHPRSGGARHRDRREGKQRTVRRGLVQAGSALRGSAGHHSRAVEFQRRIGHQGLAVLSFAQGAFRASAIQGQVAGDLGRRARTPHDSRHRSVRRRLVSRHDTGGGVRRTTDRVARSGLGCGPRSRWLSSPR